MVAAASGPLPAATLSEPVDAAAPATTPALVYDDRADIAETKRAARSRPPAHRRQVLAAPTGRAQPQARRPRPERVQPRRPRTVERAARPRQRAQHRSRPRVNIRVRAGGARARVIAYALAQVGKPYVWAADGPYGFDCSGLVKASYRTVGLSLPHQTGQLVGRGRRVSRGNLQPGDLVFPSPGHVGIYIGGGRMVHAPQRGDHVRVAPLYGFWTARRIL